MPEKSQIASTKRPGRGSANDGSLSLSWSGKADAVAAADTKSAHSLRKVAALCAGDEQSGNVILEGDNLDGLKLLLPKYENRVRLIYIDPPYNTGNAFVFHDSYEHAGWLNMMYPRLALARRMLADNGVIFVSIDDNEADKLKLVMSELFSETNFLAQITVQSNPRGRQAERHFASVHEYLLVFARNAQHCNLLGAELTEEQSQEFDLTDDGGRRYRLLGLRQRGSHSLREDRPAMYYPIYVDPDTGSISLTATKRHRAEVLPRKSTGQAGRWMWGHKRAKDNIDLLEARLIRGRNEWDIFVRDYFDDENGNSRRRKLKTIWDDKSLNYQNGKRELKQLLGKALVDYPKPTALLRKLIDLVEEKDALFMDFFAGSGTLGDAVLQANAEDGGARRFILMQQPESTEDADFPTIADVCRERVRRVVANISPSPTAVATAASLLGFTYYRTI
ncbi:MAG TPA: site-specific DNA-methyltransferase [Candidatus Obscuribacterales bacterium]